jgi:hypothetical protein
LVEQFDLDKLLNEQAQKRLDIQKQIEASIDKSKNNTEKFR